MADEPNPTLLRQSPESYGETWKADLFAQYQMYVDSADRVSERRTAANNYLLTVNTALVALYGLTTDADSGGVSRIAVPIAGILASFMWWRLVHSYRDLNRVKFKVIHELEAHLPAALFDFEWALAEKGRGKAYRPVSDVENSVPLIFIGLFALLIVSPVSRFMACATTLSLP